MNRTHTSIHAHRIDKMSGVDKTILKLYTQVGKKLIKKSANAKRRRYLKNIDNV